MNDVYSYDVTAAIVMYNNDKSMLQKALFSFLDTSLRVQIFLVDNSETDILKELASIDKRVSYIFNNSNLGFGAGHNIVIEKCVSVSKYHVILNPDVFFHRNTIEKLLYFMENHDEIGVLSPKVLYPDGSIQHLCRKLPSPFDIALKRLLPSFVQTLFKKRMDAYEYRDRNYSQIMSVPSLSGCFMFIRTEVFRKVRGFDENFFMYMEDFDFSRRVLRFYKTVYYPFVSIYHHYARESATNKKLLLVAIRSTIYYFNKWGWFFDKERKQMNLDAQKLD